MSEQTNPFADAAAVARYAEGPPRLVPGLAALHRMTLLLLAERAPHDARVLVLGAGAGWSSRSSPRPNRAGSSMASIRPPRCCVSPRQR